MPFIRRCLAAGALATALVGPSHALTLTADGSWAAFDVAPELALSGGLEWIDVATGEALSYSFTVAAGETATLTVLDAGFAGDSFSVFDGGALIGETSAPTSTYDFFATADFDAALADARFSRGVFVLGEGSYEITGLLAQSVLLPEDGSRLDSTLGALKLEMGSPSPIPEPGTYALLLAGLGAVGLAGRRRALRSPR